MHTPFISQIKIVSLQRLLPMMILILLTSTASCQQETPEGGCNNSGQDTYRTISQGGSTRAYMLHIPAGYEPNSPTPLLINFHGFGDCAEHYAGHVGDFLELNALADQERFIVAYPQGVTRKKGAPEWDPGDNGSEQIRESDPYFTEQLIAEIADTYNVDAARVYACGYSNGGMMAYGLACSRGDMIAAVGIMSGIMLSGSCDESELTSVIHFHGLADDVLPYDGGEFYQAVPEGIDSWVRHNQIPDSSRTSTQLNGGDVVREAYTGGAEQTSVVLYTIHKEHDKAGGHVWFSDAIDGRSPNQIMWEFLSQYSLED